MMRGFIMVVFGLLLLVPRGVFAGQPVLVAEELDADFGEVTQGTKVEHVFRFQNGGEEELVIDKVRSSCGCTAALLSADRLAPGARGEVRAVFDSARFRGPVAKTVTLNSNDPRNPSVEFRLHGTVRPEVEVTPDQVDLGVIAPGVSREARVVITNRGTATVRLSPPRATLPELEVKMAAGPLAPGESTEMVVRFVPGPQTRRLSGYVLLSAEGAASPEIRLPVYAVLGTAP